MYKLEELEEGFEANIHLDSLRATLKKIPNSKTSGIFTNEKELETLIQTITIYIQDIRMVFGIEKSAMTLMKSGQRETAEGIKLQKSGMH